MGARPKAADDGFEADVALPGGLRVRARAWIEAGGKGWLGHGRVRLLKAVGETGSISAAARAVGMSYRHAWGEVRAMNRLGPAPLVERTVGGRGGGGARLTPEGRAAAALFDRLDRRLQRFKTALARELASGLSPRAARESRR